MATATKRPPTDAFEGFSPALLEFLRDLEKNNDKNWFDAHRADYEGLYLEPAKRFVTAMGPGLRKISKHLRAEGRVNGSIMRIHRDTRFSKDKTPYKTGLFLLFTEGDGPMKQGAGFGLHVNATGLGMMGGMFGFDDAQLVRFRKAVVDEKAGRALERAVREVARAGYGLSAPHYKRVPRGFDKDHPRADLLRQRALFASHEESPVPGTLFGPEAVEYCLDRFEAMRPVQKWLVENL